MAFFDKVGATLQSFGNDVSNKTKTMVEVNNLTGQLKNCEDSLKMYYQEIGRLYYEKTDASGDPEIDEMFVKVKEAKQAIEHLNLSIRRAKGTKVCQSCGTEVSNATIFCPSCGAKIEDSVENVPAADMAEPVAADPCKCAHCGAIMKAGASFCMNCGTKVES